MNQHDENNVYALDASRIVRHISEVDKGKRGYYCMGCAYELIAKKGAIQQHHFAHAPRDLAQKSRCTFSDESHRHKLAKEILQRTKCIKVPPVYLFSDDRLNSLRLESSKYVLASDVKNEIQFYEDQNGDIRFGRNISFGEITNKHLLIQPDVTFFDNSGNPILLIEVVATNKVNKQKLAKIQRLGIDAIQVKIPKDSPSAIEEIFKTTINTEWLYNRIEDEQRSSGVSVPESNNKGIPSDAQHQKLLLEAKETVSCRTSQLNNLIRGIGKCLESEHYKEVEQRLRSRIQDTKGNTEKLYKRLREHRESIEKSLEVEHVDFYKQLRRKSREISQGENRFRKTSRDLEERYYKKRGELDEDARKYRFAKEGRIKELRVELAELNGSNKTSEEMESDFAREFSLQEQSIQRIIDSIKSVQSQIGIQEQEQASDRERIKEQYAERIRKRRDEIRRIEEELRESFTERSAGATENLSNGNFEGLSQHRRKYIGKSNYRQLLLDIEQGRESIRRFRKLKELLNKGKWKEKPSK